MPQKSKYRLKTRIPNAESIGERIAGIRKERGFTQTELAEKIGITQVLLSSYERNRLRPPYEIIISLSQALDATADELLGLKQRQTVMKKPSLKILRRLNRIEQLPASQQRVILQTIDNFLKGVEAG